MISACLILPRPTRYACWRPAERRVNQLLVALWPRLDAFGEAHSGPAWKQVLALSASPDPHGSRQFRCEAETAGRILRAQASRKQAFAQVLPILSDGFIRPKTDSRPAGKHRQAIKEAISALEQTRGGRRMRSRS
jgi:hypothetical protein